MSSAADDSDFELWLEQISHNPNAPSDDPGEVSPAWRRWLRHRYDTEGPVPKEVIARDALGHQLALANDAAAAVSADIKRTTSYEPRVVVEVRDDVLCIVVNDCYSAPSMWSVELSDALAEVGDYFQEQLEDELGCWPECKAHDAGLHAEVHDGAAVWWCRRGHHAVALIGELPPTS